MARRGGLPLPARLQNRACDVNRTRLLNNRVPVIDTSLGMERRMPLVVTMSMKRLFIPESVISSQRCGKDVVEFNQVSISEVEPTVIASSVLNRQEFPSRRIRQRMMLQPRRPVHQVPIIGTRISLHFHMPLDARTGMVNEPRRVSHPIRCPKTPAVASKRMPVMVSTPGGVFLGVSPSRPSQ